MSWGTAKFLSAKYPDHVAEILEDFRLLYEEKGVVRHADGTWT
jgi:hypothetical protein